jgi:uncharacterized phiE125 gp8 family phage protein
VSFAGWPGHSDLRVRYVAGYAEDHTGVPQPLRHALRLLLAHWYANREAVSAGDLKELPVAVDALISPYRNWRA